MNENTIGHHLIRICIQIHKEYGPGLLESVYHHILFLELQRQGFQVKKHQKVYLTFDDGSEAVAFIADLIINNKVIVEVKSVDTLHPVHFKQLLTYLKLSNLHLGFLVNFNEAKVIEGIRRVVNNLPENTS